MGEGEELGTKKEVNSERVMIETTKIERERLKKKKHKDRHQTHKDKA